MNDFSLSRRQFIGSLAALPLFSFEQTEPDLILHNANIFTVDAKTPVAQAVAIAGDRFMAVGTNEEILRLATGRTKKIDIGKKTILPGFIDAHSHPASSGLQHLRSVDCDLRSIQEIQSAIRKRAANTPPGNWVLGFKYDDTKTSGGRPISMLDLDDAVSDQPVFIRHRGGHTSYANSMAFKLAGITDATPNPQGGEFERNSSGKLTVRIKESANSAFEKLIPNTATRDDLREGVKLISKMMVKTGVTSVHDALGSPDDLQAYQDSLEAGELQLRIYCLIHARHIDKMIAAGVRTGIGNEWVRIGAMKMTCDGSISERTASSAENSTSCVYSNAHFTACTARSTTWSSVIRSLFSMWILLVAINV